MNKWFLICRFSLVNFQSLQMIIFDNFVQFIFVLGREFEDILTITEFPTYPIRFGIWFYPTYNLVS